eukprot:TRINITY_DN26172_c0_g1_i2.p2 TRINITY_DN26172_c0_g1~~TRINITY_DN26172_c0_g1_i2.p2  ORF type:complete len:289 (-),score=82.43 TRINITY_DN26172_c0_g1_i2:126-992(-)
MPRHLKLLISDDGWATISGESARWHDYGGWQEQRKWRRESWYDTEFLGLEKKQRQVEKTLLETYVSRLEKIEGVLSAQATKIEALMEITKPPGLEKKQRQVETTMLETFVSRLDEIESIMNAQAKNIKDFAEKVNKENIAEAHRVNIERIVKESAKKAEELEKKLKAKEEKDKKQADAFLTKIEGMAKAMDNKFEQLGEVMKGTCENANGGPAESGAAAAGDAMDTMRGSTDNTAGKVLSSRMAVEEGSVGEKYAGERATENDGGSSSTIGANSTVASRPSPWVRKSR